MMTSIHKNQTYFQNTNYLGLPDKNTTFSFTAGTTIRQLLEQFDICYKKQGVAFVVEGHLVQSTYLLRDGDTVIVIPIIVGG